MRMEKVKDRRLKEKGLECKRVVERYWWPHPYYKEARALRTRSLHRFLPCADVAIGLRYFRNGLEVDMMGNPVAPRKIKQGILGKIMSCFFEIGMFIVSIYLFLKMTFGEGFL